MRHHTDGATEAMAARIQQAAKERGATSERSRSGVDVSAMADAIGASYEMARRYAEGLATPKGEVLAELARRLRVPIAWLAHGEGARDGGVDERALEACIQAVVEAQAAAGVKLEPQRAASLVASLYARVAAGAKPDTSTLAATIRALA